ncbi:MAG: energy-coupling factor transporter transmembrane component T [Desulfobulbus oligotrophicus]|jgi:energy-coupling factor transport system permease protein|nr:energy-coupling factor transporter transmembrane component T [Desulfobulbus oligotrophicus]
MRASLFTNINTETFVAGLDVRAKLLICIAGSVASIILSSPLSLGLILGLSTILAFGAARPGTIMKAYCFGLLMMFIAMGCTALIGLAVPSLMRWNFVSLTVPFLRMLVSINLLLMLALSTPVQELFNRLRMARLPTWLQIPLSVAIRFIPTFLEDCAQIRDAARLRPSRGLTGLWRGMVVPLLFRVLYSADDLAMAAELKGISTAGQAGGEALPGLGQRDFVMLTLTVVAFCAAIALQHFGPRFTPLPM